jgi:carboxyl-terminal processing protease
MSTMTKGAASLATGLLLLFASCGGSPSPQESTSTDTSQCSVAGQNTQILAVMQSWYYWYATLPASVDAVSYTSADALLDALRQQPLDRFSYITTQAANQSFYGAGQYVGFGLGFRLSTANDLVVTQVFPDGPADQAGLVRGDTVTGLNGASVPSLVASNQLDAVLGAGSSVGATIAFTYTDLQSRSHTANVTSAVVTQPSVSETKILQVGNRKAGYFLFNSFIDTTNDALDRAFSRFADLGVTELIIDERYNGGGEVSVAQHLASLIAGNSYTGKTLGTLTFNDKHADQNQAIAFQNVTDPLNLTRVVFITSRSSASASEFIINSLVPYLKVVTVGHATFGKPVGENGFNVCTNVLYPITFKIENSRGYGDYFDGLPATCSAADDLTHPLGDPEERSLAAALGYVRTGGCGATAAAPGEASALDDVEAGRSHRTARYGWRQLVGAY